MLDADSTPQRGCRKARGVARREDCGMAGSQPLVHHDPVVDLEPSRGREVGLGDDSESCNDGIHLSVEVLAGFELASLPLLDQVGHLPTGEDLDALELNLHHGERTRHAHLGLYAAPGHAP